MDIGDLPQKVGLKAVVQVRRMLHKPNVYPPFS